MSAGHSTVATLGWKFGFDAPPPVHAAARTNAAAPNARARTSALPRPGSSLPRVDGAWVRGLHMERQLVAGDLEVPRLSAGAEVPFRVVDGDRVVADQLVGSVDLALSGRRVAQREVPIGKPGQKRLRPGRPVARVVLGRLPSPFFSDEGLPASYLLEDLLLR